MRIPPAEQKMFAIIGLILLVVLIPCISFVNSPYGSIRKIRKGTYESANDLHSCRFHLEHYERFNEEVEDTILAFCSRKPVQIYLKFSQSVSSGEALKAKHYFSGLPVEKRIDSLIISRANLDYEKAKKLNTKEGWLLFLRNYPEEYTKDAFLQYQHSSN